MSAIEWANFPTSTGPETCYICALLRQRWIRTQAGVVVCSECARTKLEIETKDDRPFYLGRR